MTQLTLQEHFENWNNSLSIDAENRVILNVALAGHVSRNGYRYSDDALSEAAPLYSGKPVFLDHAANRQRPQERSTRDLVGSIINPRFVSGRIRGDIRVLETEAGQVFWELVESNAAGVGMSHVVLAERSPDGKSVARVSNVLSVDVVVNPATTNSFSESVCLGCQTDSAAADTDGTGSTINLPQQERDLLKEEVARLKAQLEAVTLQEEIRQQIAASGIPVEALTECFRRQLETAPNAHHREQLLHDRLQLVSKKQGFRTESFRAVSHSRTSGSASASVDEEFVRLLKRR